MYTQILASFRFGEHPWTSAPQVFCNFDNMLDGGGDPKSEIRYLAKIAAPSSDYPNFRSHHPPSDSVNFIGLPSPHVLCNLDYMLYGWGRKPKSPIRYLAKIVVLGGV